MKKSFWDAGTCAGAVFVIVFISVLILNNIFGITDEQIVQFINGIFGK